jgi:hypothetical protein
MTEFLLESWNQDLSRVPDQSTMPEIIWQSPNVDLYCSVVYSQNFGGSKNNWMVEYRADFTGVVNYQRFTAMTTTTTDRNQDEYDVNAEKAQMMSLLTNWTWANLKSDLHVLRDQLYNSDEPVLQHHSALRVLPEENDPPLAINVVTTDNEPSIRNDILRLSLLVLLPAVACVVIISLLVTFNRKQARINQLQHQGGIFQQPQGSAESTIVLPGRHGEAIETLQASERYLAQHRPDHCSDFVSEAGTATTIPAKEKSPSTPTTTEIAPKDPW